jgi:hypothetical protein
MKLAVTDACIFIDLYELELTAEFFSLGFDVHTSLDVFNELYSHQQQLLRAYCSVNRLTVHNITTDDRLAILAGKYPKSLSDNDRTVIHLALKLGALLLSSDKTVRQFAKKKAIEYHGMLWIFDRLVDGAHIDKPTAAHKLKKLIQTNIVYHNNDELVYEMNKRLNQWR